MVGMLWLNVNLRTHDVYRSRNPKLPLSSCRPVCVCSAAAVCRPAFPCRQVYYPVRHQLLVHMVNSVQRLAFSTNGTPEQKKLAVDLAEVIVRWEIVRKEDEVSCADRLADKGLPVCIRTVSRSALVSWVVAYCVLLCVKPVKTDC